MEVVTTILGAVVVLALIGGSAAAAAPIILHHTLLTDDGTVSLDGDEGVDPELLARDAGVSLDEYALARMVESETRGLRETARLGVAYAAVTYAREAGKGIAELLLHSTGSGDGFFGRQAQGRYAATSKDPSPASFDAAAAALAGELDDPTGGADQWDSPHAYEDPVRADEVAAARAAAGKVKVLVAGVSESTLRFWRPA